MLELKIFVLELLTVDRLASGSVASCEVAPLKHELLDDSMKY